MHSECLFQRDNPINLDTQFDLKAELPPETHSETQIHVDESVNSAPPPEWPRKGLFTFLCCTNVRLSNE